MGQWLDAARAAKQKTVDIKHSDIRPPVQLVQKVHLIPETPINCTKCTKCTDSCICGTDGQQPDEWRRGFALLITSPAPKGITAVRWRQFIQDAEHFMTDWAEKANALGWTAVDVFGLHPLAPAHRADAAGLVWLLHGHEIAALSEGEAIIRISDSRKQTFHKRARGGVPAWELTEAGNES